MKTLIAGGGIGGLALAAGLRQAGLDVAVFEKDATPADWLSGYRIHIDPAGSAALRACVPSETWAAFEASAAQPPRGIGFVTDQLRELLRVDFGSGAALHHPISRVALRTILLQAAGPSVQFGKQVVDYDRPGDGSVRVQFADGSTDAGDVLVGADGSASRVRKRLVPEACVIDTGCVGIAGQCLAVDDLPARFRSDMLNVLPPGGTGMFIAPFLGASAKAGSRNNLPDHVFWAFVARAERLGITDGDVRSLPPDALLERVQHAVATWHPHVRRLVAGSAPNSVIGVPLLSAAPVSGWPTSNVTLLGDAIHTMTPLQGLGGNTALHDADALRRALIGVARGESDVAAALGGYEASMRGYGFEAVQRSLRIAELGVSDDAFGRLGFKALLRIASRVPPLKARMFPRQY